MDSKQYIDILKKNNEGTLLEKLNRINLKKSIIKEFEILDNILKQIYNDDYDIIIVTKEIFIVKVKIKRIKITKIKKDNTQSGYHVIRNLFVSYQIVLDDDHLYFKSDNIGLERNLFTEVEYDSGYVHSHINRTPVEVSYEYDILTENTTKGFCNGSSNIAVYIKDINDAFLRDDKNINHTLLRLFTYMDLSYLTVESEVGVPYKYIKNIKYKDLSSQILPLPVIGYNILNDFFNYLNKENIYIPIYFNNNYFNVKEEKLTKIVFDYCINKYIESDKVSELLSFFCKKENIITYTTESETFSNLQKVFKYLKDKNELKKNKTKIIKDLIESDIECKIFFKNEFLDTYVKKVIFNNSVNMNDSLVENIKENLHLNVKLINIIEFIINTLINE